MALRLTTLAASLACLAAFYLAEPAHAQGDSSAPATGEPMQLSPEDAATFAKSVERTLAEKGARIALVFRSGRPREDLPEGISYTHGAFWVWQAIDTPDRGRIEGYVTYNLYHGDGQDMPVTQSYLATDFPFDFIAPSREDDVAIIIPTQEVQRRIHGVISSATYEALHVPDYSLISSVSDARFQNCNEFMLDVIAAGVWETADYAQIKANLGASFVGSRIAADPLMRVFGPMVDARLRLDDHDGKLRTATFESLSEFMLTHGYASESFILHRDVSPAS
jgi:hypothetical protein